MPDPLRDPNEVPEHLKRLPPPRLPRDTWKKMTPEQRVKWEEWSRKYVDDLNEELRQRKKREYGY